MNKLKGFSALLATSILYAINDNLIRIIGGQLSTYQQLFLRTLVGFIFITIIIFITKPKWNLKKLHPINLSLYTFAFPVTVIFFTIGIMSAKIASVVFAFYGGSFLFSFLAGIFFFKEKATKAKIISLGLTIIGLFLFTYPFNIKDINVGFICGLLAGGLMVFSNSINKHIGGKINFEILTFLQMLGGIILGSIFVISLKQSLFPPLSLPMIVTIIVSGFFLMCVVFLAAVGFKHFDLNLGTIVTSLELFFAPLFALFLFREFLSIFEILGGICIALAIVIPHVPKKFIK